MAYLKQQHTLLENKLTDFRNVPLLTDDIERFKLAYPDIVYLHDLKSAQEVFRLVEHFGSYNIASYLLLRGYIPDTFDWKSIEGKIAPTKFPLPYYPPGVFSYYLTKGWNLPDEVTTHVLEAQTWWFLTTGRICDPALTTTLGPRWMFLDYFDIHTGTIHGSIQSIR
jgi:hypothetical protein